MWTSRKIRRVACHERTATQYINSIGHLFRNNIAYSTRRQTAHLETEILASQSSLFKL